MENPVQNRVSIVIPVYNLEKTVRACLDSVLAQSCDNLEILAVDDGSRDASGDILEEYARKYPEKVRVIHQDNAGVTAARLRGAAEASGDWIGFVDGDDVIEPDMFQMLLQNGQNTGADISHCGYQMIFEDGRVRMFHGTGAFLTLQTEEGLRELLIGERIEPGLCNKLYRRELFDSLLQSEEMDRNIQQTEDLLMNFLLFSRAKLSVFSDVCPYHYLVRTGSASRKKPDEHILFDPVAVKRQILALAPESLLLSARKSYLTTVVDMYDLAAVSGKGEYKTEMAALRKELTEHREWFSLLGNRKKICAAAIWLCPALYRFAYRIYAKFFQEKQYE